jgi:hypothetical protein
MIRRRILTMILVPMAAASVFAISNTANASQSASSLSPSICWWVGDAFCCNTPTPHCNFN